MMQRMAVVKHSVTHECKLTSVGNIPPLSASWYVAVGLIMLRRICFDDLGAR